MFIKKIYQILLYTFQGLIESGLKTDTEEAEEQNMSFLQTLSHEILVTVGVLNYSWITPGLTEKMLRLVKKTKQKTPE